MTSGAPSDQSMTVVGSEGVSPASRERSKSWARSSLTSQPVVVPVLRQWDVFNLSGLDADGEIAREEVAAQLDTLERQASRFEERRAARAARIAATS